MSLMPILFSHSAAYLAVYFVVYLCCVCIFGACFVASFVASPWCLFCCLTWSYRSLMNCKPKIRSLHRRFTHCRRCVASADAAPVLMHLPLLSPLLHIPLPTALLHDTMPHQLHMQTLQEADQSVSQSVSQLD